jgi:type I restriction enzyme, S subunit
MAVKEGYKQTEIGVIPEDWVLLKTEEIVSIQTGSKNTVDNKKDGLYPFFVRSQSVERIDTHSYDCEAVLTAGDGVGTGKVFHYINGKFDVHQRVYVMSNFDGVLGKFYYFYFSRFFLDEVLKYTAKSSVDSVRRDMIAKMLIPLPPMEEQKAIATALSEIGGLIDSLSKLKEKKKNIKQGAIQELLTGKKRLEGFNGEWEEVVLGDLASFSKGVGLSKAEIANHGTYKCIHYGELFTDYKEFIFKVKSRTFYDEKKVLSEKNDVLMPTSDVTPRGLATASCINEQGVLIGGDILIIKSINTLDGLFLSYVIRYDKKQVLQLVSGTTVYHLYASDMKMFKLLVPPTIEEQTAIANILSDMDSEIETLQTKLDKYKSIKQGMMQELLTGRIRLLEGA